MELETKVRLYDRVTPDDEGDWIDADVETPSGIRRVHWQRALIVDSDTFKAWQNAGKASGEQLRRQIKRALIELVLVGALAVGGFVWWTAVVLPHTNNLFASLGGFGVFMGGMIFYSVIWVRRMRRLASEFLWKTKERESVLLVKVGMSPGIDLDDVSTGPYTPYRIASQSRRFVSQ